MTYRWQVEFLVIVAIITSIVSVSGSTENSWFGSEFTVVQKLYDDCQEKNDIVACLKGKALSALSKAVEQDTLSVLDGITFVRQQNESEVTDPSILEGRFINGLSGIDRALLQKLDKFFRTHTLKVDMSEGREKGGLGGGGGGGGGKKGKNYSRYIMAALLTAMGIAGPLGLKALAAIAGKALVISKVALTIAGIIALKKIFSSDHHEETSFQVHSSGDHNRRNTYLVRPVKPAAPAPVQYVDPYRYYYEHYPAAQAN